MRNLAYIVLLISFCVEASDFRYNYDAELEVGSRYYGNTENCLYKMFCLPYFLDIGIEAAIVYKDGYKFNVGIRNDSICLIICADKNFMVNGYKIGDVVDCNISEPINVKQWNYHDIGNGWYAPINLTDMTISFFLKYDFGHNNYNEVNHDLNTPFYYNYDAELKLGERYYGDAVACDSMTIPFSKQKVKSVTIYKDGVRYRLGLSENDIISIIRCDQSIVIGEYINFKQLEYISGNAKISSKSDYYYVYLTDGWWIEMKHGNSLNTRGLVKYDGWIENKTIIHTPLNWSFFCGDFFTDETYQRKHIKYPLEIVTNGSVKYIASKEDWSPIMLSDIRQFIMDSDNEAEIKTVEVNNSGTRQLLTFKLFYHIEPYEFDNEICYEQRVWYLVKVEDIPQIK